MAAAIAPKQTQILHTGAARYAQAITKSDQTTYQETRGLYVGGTGDVAVKMVGDGGTVTFATVPAGVILPICVTQVLSTGTTATGIIALW